jgi:predicted ATPase/class 3 adenylate cyclase
MALRASHPSGTVTLLFTDIEGSTQRWDSHGAAMEVALVRHDILMRGAIEAQGGYIFKTVGDAFCAAFAHASDAISACISAQRALCAEDFSAVGGLRVRCALHTGEAVERDSDYFGPTVNRAARLMSIGHGGQVLISGATRDLAHGDLPAGAMLVDLGLRHLHDLTEPEHVWQLSIAGLPAEFPSLFSLDELPNNVPIQRSSFVGRERDVAKVKELLERHRLLTLVGSGGVGKTRLAIQTAADLLHRYPDGVWFVDLAPIGDPELVASVVAQAIGMSQRQDRRVGEAIPEWLRRKKLLLILDNCEHVIEPLAALAAAILSTAQDVRIVATSRQGLNISGEAVHRLPSLTVPAEVSGLTRDDALRYGAVVLFVDRAHAADSRFVLTDDNAPIIAEICRRLDGIALALELAAARVKVLSISNLAQRLNERFKLLTGGSRDVLPRQKTLTALIDWSYDLLAPQEQVLFNRLGVFAGGFGFDAATAVCGGEGLDKLYILDLLSSLTDKSLVVADTSGGTERYRLLESMAAYALEKLAALGERASMARRHAEYFCDEAEAADERYGTGSTIALLAGVELELDNYRAALEWALTHNNDPLLGGGIASGLVRLWFDAGLTVEGRYWIERALSNVSEAEHPAMAAALQLGLAQVDPFSIQRSYEAAQRATQLYESIGDRRGASRAQQKCGQALYRMGQFETAREVITQALATSRACGDTQSASHLAVLADIEGRRGDFGAARELHAQALAGFKALGDEPRTAWVLGSMAELEFAAGDPKRALCFANEALELAFLGKPSANVAVWHNNSAVYRIALGDLSGARESAHEGLRFARQVQQEMRVAIALQHLALLAGLGSDARRAAQLLGYVDARYERVGTKRESTEQWGYDKLVAALRKAWSNDEIAKLVAEGACWSEDQAVEKALAV